MPSTSQDITPQDPRACAFQWLVRRLQRDDKLARLVRPANWFVPDGSDEFTADLPADANSIRLIPTYEAAGEIAVLGGGRIQQESPVLVQVETRSVGLHGDTPINLWGIIESAAWPATPKDQQVMREYGVSWLEFVQP